MKFHKIMPLTGLKQQRLSRKLAIALVIASVLAVLITVGILASFPPFGPSPNTVILLLAIDSILLLLLAALVARQIVPLWVRKRHAGHPAKLHKRLTILFAITAAAPSIIVITFSALFFHFGVEQWFSKRINTALTQSLAVAEAYLEEHKQVIRADVLAMANDLNLSIPLFVNDADRLRDAVQTQAMLRSLTETLLFDSKMNILAKSGLTFSLEFETIPSAVLERARRGQVVLTTNENGDRVRALIRLERFVDAYLYVGRAIDPQVISYTASTRAAVEAYQQLKNQQSSLQLAVLFIFFVIGLLLLMAATWTGLYVSTRLLQPLHNLIEAAERIRSGDLTTQVAISSSKDETRTLTLAFNRMASELATQQSALLTANTQLDQRRQFTEAVLEGVSAGVLGLDSSLHINIANKRAIALLQLPENYSEQPLPEFLPEIKTLLTESSLADLDDREEQMVLSREGWNKTLLLRIQVEFEEEGQELYGYVITFDDMTEFLHAQKMAAWADVARRLAHEIKNPLTPIQLSAERLQRKYLPQIKDGEQTFTSLTDTIIRQVNDIGRMVTEFSEFARLPQPKRLLENVVAICRETVLLLQQGNPSIHFIVEAPENPVLFNCDAGLMRQALTNILKNAAEAISERDPNTEQTSHPKGEIVLKIQELEEKIFISIIDNGKGLPTQNREQLTQPYYTSRTKGTGLGLAIVKKIVEEHGGVLKIEDNQPAGAKVTLCFTSAAL